MNQNASTSVMASQELSQDSSSAGTNQWQRQISSSEHLFFKDSTPTKFSFLKRLGQYLLWTNIGALILLFGALSVLTFLWFWDDNNNSWRQVMIEQRIGQAITLCTVVIRVAVATQASTAVAMLAAAGARDLDREFE